ncbi:30S ribosomal protein S6--L-glutamate ligase [Candidatus Saccharibacteria bacterium]|nr:30S ribosomal protein S6--L-glutamate ligase [Candidatus Saccharibacteria bacterium]
MKIVILSRSNRKNGSERLLGAALERGHQAKIVDYTKCYCNVVKSKPQVYYAGKPLEGIDAVIPRISISSQSYGSAIIRQFEMMNVFSTTGSLAFIRTRDKLRSMQLLARHDIDIPKTVVANSTDSTDEVIAMVGGAPLIVKVARGSQGMGVMLAETRSAAKAIIQAFYSQKVNILIQEFIEESSGTDVRVFIVGGKIVGAMKRQAPEGEFRSNIYLGGHGVPIKLTRPERQMALEAAKAMNLDIAGVDLLQAERGPLVMEVNAFPMLAAIEEVTKHNIAGKIIEYVENHVPKKRKKDKVGA